MTDVQILTQNPWNQEGVLLEKKWTSISYQEQVKKKTPPSKLFRNFVRAFWVGGLICVFAQILISILKNIGLHTDTISAIVPMTMIFIGAFLTGLNIYDNIGSYAGAGSIVPITGFANSIVAPAMEFKSEGYVLGVGARMFVIAGPVLVYGLIISTIGGILYYLLLK